MRGVYYTEASIREGRPFVGSTGLSRTKMELDRIDRHHARREAQDKLHAKISLLSCSFLENATILRVILYFIGHRTTFSITGGAIMSDSQNW